MPSTELRLGLADDEIAGIRHRVPGNKVTARYDHHKFGQEKRRNLLAWEKWLISNVKVVRNGVAV